MGVAACGLGGPLSRVDAAEEAALRATLSSADTAISVEAGAHAPRLTTLTLESVIVLRNQTEEPPPEHAEAQGVTRSLSWQFDPAASRATQEEVRLVYVSASPQLRLTWLWRVRAGFGPIEHTVLLENLGSEVVWLPLQPSFRFDWQVDSHSRLESFWVEKGADTPSAQGTHLQVLEDPSSWHGTSSTYARPVRGEPREMIPYVLVGEPEGARRGWYLGVEFSGRTRISLQRQASSVRGEAGLNPTPGPYRTQLPPGATFVTPPIFIGAFSDGPDGAGNRLRRWIRATLNSPHTVADPSYPLLVSNSWGSGMAVDEALARRMILDAQDLGLELFHLDAGWFRGVGDWRPDPEKFPRGIASVADFAHAHGLRFGLWIDWAQAGTSHENGALNIRDPVVRDWLVADPPEGWVQREAFKGITIDLGVPAAATWAQGELERLVRDYHLDMLEHDGYLVAQGSSRTGHPAAPPDPSTLRVYEDSGYLWAEGSNSTDVSYHATAAYYRIYEQLRAHYPRVLLEVCNDGGRMVDFGSAAHGDYFSTTDTYDPLSNRRAFYDASYVLPPAMLESYVAAWPAPHIGNFRYMLRSGMLGWFSLMLDTGRWSEHERAEARVQFALYKSALRPLIRTADVYHVSPRPDGIHWDGIEYHSAALGRGVLYAFRGSAPGESVHRFRLRGLKPQVRYALKFQDRPPARPAPELTGRQLMQEGVAVDLPSPLTSELLFFEQVPATAVRPPH